MVGLVGEIGVCKSLDELSRVAPIKYIHNFPVKTPRGFQQIDVVGISEHGLFAFEVKNWSGQVHCAESDYYWNVVYKNNTIFTKSPLIQNASHARYLEALTGISVKSYVIFPSGTHLINKLENTIYLSELGYVVQKERKLISENQIDIIYEKLLQAKKTNEPAMISDMMYYFMGGNQSGMSEV